MTSYKNCAVPMCRSNNVNYANKLFIRVPKSPKRRKQWLELAGRDKIVTSDKSTMFFCEDHFDLPKDMKNYMQYNIMGTVNQIRMNPDSLPSKFECQLTDRPRDIIIQLYGEKDKLNTPKKRPVKRRQSRTVKIKKAKMSLKSKRLRECVSDSGEEEAKAEEETTAPADMTDEEWLDCPNVCRCCLSMEASWDLTSTYVSDDGEVQVYLDMIMECLGIKMSNMSEFGPSKVICDKCVRSLQSAHKFKRQVLRVEEMFAAHQREKEGEDVKIKSEPLEPLALVDIFETHDCDVEIKLENLDEYKAMETYNMDNLETAFISTNHLEHSRRDDLQAEDSVDTSHGAGCLSADESTSTQVFHRTTDNNTQKGPYHHTADHSYTKPMENSNSETESENETGSMKMCHIEKILEQSNSKNRTMEFTPSGVKMESYNKAVRVTSRASPMSSLEGSSEKVGNKCFSNIKSNVDYDSDTPLAELCETADDVDAELTDSKKGRCSDEHNLSVCKAPQNAPPLMKQVSERRRIKQTCDTVLRDTTACPFRHHRSWFQCFYCPLDFMAMDMLRKHTTLDHNSEDMAQIKRYPRTLQIEITELKCKICNVDLTDVKDMVRHFLDVHQKVVYKECIADYKVNASPFSCHLCCKQYHVFRTLTTHLNEHYANCICDVCGKSFLNTKRLKVHKRTHENGHFPCSECGKILKTKTSKANHMETHLKRVLKCHICLQPMKHYNDRIKHMSEAHNITYKFKCPICGREYNIKHYLATHMRQTHGHKNKKCSECNMAFVTNHGLKKHMLKHTGVKAFPCTICSKSYARSYTLKEHLRCHEGEVKFVGE